MDLVKDSRFCAVLPFFGLLVVLFGLLSPKMALAHEPLFSLGPHTLYKGGVGIEFETELRSTSKLLRNGDKISDPLDQKATRLILPTEIIYGVSPDLALTARIPVIYRTFEQTNTGDKTKKSSRGLGDIALRSKYRFWRRDSLGVQQAAAVVLGIKLPTGDDGADPPLGTGSTDFLLGLTAAHEGRRLYAFGDLRYRLNTEADDLRVGDVFFYDVAVGFRPILTDYYRPDLVFLLELNGEVAQKDDRDGAADSDSGGHTVWLGPNFLLSYRNIMMKGGIRFPIVQELNGTQLGHDYESVLATEIHF